MPEPRALSSGLDSKTSIWTPAFASWMAVARPATPLPAIATLLTAVMWENLSVLRLGAARCVLRDACCARRYSSAMGLTGEPTAPVIGSGGAERRNS